MLFVPLPNVVPCPPRRAIPRTALRDLQRPHGHSTASKHRRVGRLVRRQGSLDRMCGLKKGEFLAHRNVHRSEDETANSIIEGAG